MGSTRLLHGLFQLCCLAVTRLVTRMLRELLRGFQRQLTRRCPDTCGQLRQQLRGHLSVFSEMFPDNCPDDSPDATRTANRTPTRTLRVRRANCFADFTCKCQDIAEMLPSNCTSRCADIHRCCVRCIPAVARTVPGHFRDTGRMIPGCCAEYCPDDSPDAARMRCRT